MNPGKQQQTLCQWFWDRDEIPPQTAGHILIMDWTPQNRIIAKSLMFLVAAKEPTDFVTVHDDLERDGLLAMAGGLPYLQGCLVKLEETPLRLVK